MQTDKLNDFKTAILKKVNLEAWDDFYFDNVLGEFRISVAISAFGLFSTEKVANKYR